MNKWKAGDVVILKSGGPTMTVECYENLGMGVMSEYVVCTLFDGYKKISESIHEDALKLAEE